MTLPTALADVRQLLLPRACVGCATPGCWWCRDCARSSSGPPVFLDEPGLGISFAHEYASPVRELILAYKESGLLALAAPLAELLTAAVVAHPARYGRLTLVPVPATGRSRRRRGGDVWLQVTRLAGRTLGLPVTPALSLVRQPRAQKELSRHDRAGNLAFAMALRNGGVIGRRCLLVDDVLTTGATLHEGVRAIRAGGAVVAGAATIAAVRRPGLSRPDTGD